MKKFAVLLVTFLLVLPVAEAQKYKLLKEEQQLKMSKSKGEEFAGVNGACIAWHPAQKKYYAGMAGNSRFPLAVFDKSGDRLSPDKTTTLIDLRGLWYNSANKTLCGNGYNDNGWFEYELDGKGEVKDIDIKIADMVQPNEHSVGTFNTKDKQVIFLDGSALSLYSMEGTELKKIQLHPGKVKDKNARNDEEDESLPEAYNFTTVIYTGKKKAEIGLLNTAKKQVELYDISNGYLTTIMQLPESVTVYEAFNFCFTNDSYWFFDKETRVWTGFK